MGFLGSVSFHFGVTLIEQEFERLKLSDLARPPKNIDETGRPRLGDSDLVIGLDLQEFSISAGVSVAHAAACSRLAPISRASKNRSSGDSSLVARCFLESDLPCGTTYLLSKSARRRTARNTKVASMPGEGRERLGSSSTIPCPAAPDIRALLVRKMPRISGQHGTVLFVLTCIARAVRTGVDELLLPCDYHGMGRDNFRLSRGRARPHIFKPRRQRAVLIACAHSRLPGAASARSGSPIPAS